MSGVAVTRAEAARMALSEFGVPDLAALVGTNKVGNPMRPARAMDEVEALLVARAFQLAHDRPMVSDRAVAVAEMFRVAMGVPDGWAEPPDGLHWSPRTERWVGDYVREDWIRFYGVGFTKREMMNCQRPRGRSRRPWGPWPV